MHRLLIRTLLLVVVAGGLFWGIVWLKNRDPGRPLADIPAIDSRGYIAALMQTHEGDRLVAIDAKGNIRNAPGTEEVQDKEIAWKPDGRRIIYVSNYKTDGSFQNFEWKPDRDNDPYQLTPNGASRQNPWFVPDGSMFLYASQGDILATTYQQLKTHKVMPPSDDPNAEQNTEEGGGGAPESHVQDKITEKWLRLAPALEGEAFSKGYLDKTKKFFAGIYTTSRGYDFVIQHLEPEDEAHERASVPVGGDSIEVAMDRENPQAVISVQNFRYPLLDAVPKDRIKADGTIQRDFVNAVFIAHLDSGVLTPIFAAPDDSVAMISPALSSDGSEVALVVKAKPGKSNVAPGLLIAPVERGGISSARQIAAGDISEPSWAPDGQTIVFIRGGDVWTVRPDGTVETNITNGKGKFRSPLFSPMR